MDLEKMKAANDQIASLTGENGRLKQKLLEPAFKAQGAKNPERDSVHLAPYMELDPDTGSCVIRGRPLDEAVKSWKSENPELFDEASTNCHRNL